MADVDIAFISTSDIDLYATHNAVSDRLEWIRTHHGQNAYERTVANILVAKQILKAGQAYKRVEHGGWGGVGTENWILANGGNFLEACRTFWDVAHTQTGQVVPFDEFVQSYPIINPGVNLRDDRHDNYTRNMNEKGYQAMLKVIGDYLGVE